MIRYVIKRLLLVIPVIICATFIVYFLMDLAPGNVVESIVNSSSEPLSQEQIDALMRQYDLDKPMLYRYGKYIANLFRGNLGVGDITKIDVWESYIQKLPNTLLLSLTSLVIGASCAIPLGIFAAKRAGSLIDNGITLLTLVGISMPAFWLGLLLLQLFSLRLGWLPAGGNRDGIRSLILPSISGALMLMMSVTRATRSSMLDHLHADYLRTARAKGVPENVVINKHALGNAWIPILTTLGGSLAGAVSGSAIVETVFSYPGIGRMSADAVRARDITTSLGCITLTTIFYVVMLLVVDLLYAFVDPRIRAQYVRAKKRKSAA